MSISAYFTRALAVLGVVGVAATASASQAAAFGGGHIGSAHVGGIPYAGGGLRMGGGLHINGGPRFGNGPRFVGGLRFEGMSRRMPGPALGFPRPSFAPFGSHVPHFPVAQHGPKQICIDNCQNIKKDPKNCGFAGCTPITNSCRFSSDPMCHPAKMPCWIHHICGGPIGPVGPVVCRFGRCFPVFPPPVVVQPIVIPQPIYQRPIYRPVYQAVAPSYAPPPAAYSPPAPAVQQPTVLSVVFQPTATSADITSFVKSYNVTVSSGPDANGVYRVQISAGAVPQDQLNQIVQSMQSQTSIVAQVGA